MKDLREGRTTHWAARNIYHVAYDEVTLRVDAERTLSLREEARSNRIKAGKPFDEFEEEWLKLSPPRRLLQYYGGFPNPKPQPKMNIFG